jgi:hypothetical protein
MTRSKADRRAKEARNDKIKSRSPYPASRAQAQQKLAMTRSKADRRAKEARDDRSKADHHAIEAWMTSWCVTSMIPIQRE